MALPYLQNVISILETGLKNDRGRKTGVYSSWSECEKHVKGYTKCWFKSFKNKPDAAYFVEHGKCKPVRKLTDFVLKFKFPQIC